MPRRVLVQRDNESFDLIEVPAPNEHHLQEVLKASPQLVPTEDLGIDGELLVVGRETTLASGYIDLLCLSRSGEVVLIEFKTGPQNPDFRHALAQVIDYGSDLWRMSVDEFDRGVVQRYLTGGRAESRYAGARDLRDAVARSPWDLSDEEHETLLSRLADVLATGDFHYVVAAQRFTPSMATSLEYLNATMRFGRFFLIEVIQLEGAGLTANSAQVVSRPAKRSSGGSTSSPGRATEAEFLNSVDDPGYRDAVADVLSTCASLGIQVAWRDKGASFRLPNADRAEPLSIGWLLPEGSHWAGAKYLTFGVDGESLKQVPTLAEPVARYVTRVSSLPGARLVSSKRADRFVFEPPAAVANVDAIRQALSDLVSEVNQ
jgi:hypothetical protein